MLKGKKILIGISGSIAAYKIPDLIRLLIKEGVEVRVVMTSASKSFVTPLTISTVSKNAVLTDLMEGDTWSNHVLLGRWADLMIVAPLSCNTLAKMSVGLCDNLLMAVYLSATCPVVVAPAMDEDMWLHASTKANLSILLSRGTHLISVGHGELASGLIGEGRMAEPFEILEWVKNYFLVTQSMSGKKVLITAGPTHEPIDAVRFIGNRSSGKMGLALANECLKRGAQVKLVFGPTQQAVPSGIECLHVQTAAEMYEACIDGFETIDIACMCAAVADYSAVSVSNEKIKKSSQSLNIALQPTKDILKHLGFIKKEHQLLVGFALETSNGEAYALKKLKEKNADFIVLNTTQDEGAGFGYDTNKVTIFDKSGAQFPFELKSKQQVAADIIDTILKQ
jgi:phosphopantothenoylcysteine decarboxylase/phosphopantothenate--cysteine ligase